MPSVTIERNTLMTQMRKYSAVRPVKVKRLVVRATAAASFMRPPHACATLNSTAARVRFEAPDFVARITHEASRGAADRRLLARPRRALLASGSVGRPGLLLHVLPPYGAVCAAARLDLLRIEQATAQGAGRSRSGAGAARIRETARDRLDFARTARGLR